MKGRATLLPAAAAALSALTLAGGAGAQMARLPTLVGTVGPGFTIKLTEGGKPVKVLKAGRYRVVVHDKSPIHNFAFKQRTGGHARLSLTTVAFVGTKTVTVRFGKGRWEFYCSPHATIMFGYFKVR